MLINNKMTKAFEIKSNIKDADEVQEITVARTPMINKKPVCVTCNQPLALKMGVKNL